MSSTTHHTLSYIEFGVTDLAATRAFYESAFGWTVNDYGPHYAGIRAASGDGEVGEDEADRAIKELDEITKSKTDEIDRLLAAKEAELLEV